MLEKARAWLRRTMPRVAFASALLIGACALVGVTSLDESSFDELLESLALFLSVATGLYYSVRALRWLKRKLLWRVRRRLIITYAFVGLTPVVLLSLLVWLASMVFAGQAMSRIVNVQIDATERETLASARALVEALSSLPQDADAETLQTWLDERAKLLHGALPGARVALWRSDARRAGALESPDAISSLGERRAADFLSEPAAGEEFRGVGANAEASFYGEPLPEWLRGRAEWSGFAYVAPRADAKETFGTPSIRALVRAEIQGRGHALMLVVPVSRALVRGYREATGINVKPFFIGADNINFSSDGERLRLSRIEEGERRRQEGETEAARDQFGDPLDVSQSYLAVLPATDWRTGERATRVAFLFDFSWFSSLRQIVAGTSFGEMLQRALFWVAAAFLILEILALAAAAWMTRAVTGTVHRLYQATESVKRGDFSHRIRVGSRDQLGELALAFNEMSANIETLLVERVEHERLKREVEIAHDVQAQLFPRSVPPLESAAITGECRAARGVAGDYYDYVEIEPGLVAFALGDVAGKGISAALVMSNLQASLRAQVAIIAERRKIASSASVAATAQGVSSVEREEFGPCGVTGVDTSCAVENMVSNINQQLCKSTEGNRYATLFLALYDERTQLLRYTNAGHNAPVLVRSDGSVERLTAGGTIVGAFDFAAYEEAQMPLAAGDLLVVFSDGLSEARNDSGEEYGEERLARFAAERHDLFTAENLRRAIFEEIDEWTKAEERGDDQTLMILKVTK